MSELSNEGAAGASEEQPVTQIITAGGEDSLSVTDAARTLAQVRKPKDRAGERRQEVKDQATQQAREESTTAKVEVGAAPVEEQAPGETESAETEAAGLPAIEPPRSWTAEDKELFKALPRETQERLADRERARERDFRRSQDEAADKLKGLTAKEQAAEQARQQYEAALPQLLVMLQQQQAGEFADIRTLADVERMAREDWPRYALWDVQQKKIAEVTRQLTEVQQHQLHETLQQFAEFAKREDDLFKEKVPDMADARKAAELQTACLATLTGLGFAEAELARSWQGRKDLSLRDHRVQLLIRDATLWREAQAKARTAAAKPVPPVQRPGTAQPRGAAQEAQIQNLNLQLEKSSGVNALRAAAKLVATRRAAAR